eukprot:1194477-Prorocentrum_minimum.AAC.3
MRYELCAMRYELCAMNFALCAMNYALCVSDSRRRGRGRHRGHATILMTDQSDAWIMGIFSRRANRTQEVKLLQLIGEPERLNTKRIGGVRQPGRRALSGPRGEQWEKVGNWTQGEKRGRGAMGVECTLAVIGTRGPAK